MISIWQKISCFPEPINIPLKPWQLLLPKKLFFFEWKVSVSTPKKFSFFLGNLMSWVQASAVENFPDSGCMDAVLFPRSRRFGGAEDFGVRVDPLKRKGVDVHPWRLTWNIIMEVWKIIFLSKWVICRFHVNLPGCNHWHNWQLEILITKVSFYSCVFFFGCVFGLLGGSPYIPHLSIWYFHTYVLGCLFDSQMGSSHSKLLGGWLSSADSRRCWTFSRGKKSQQKTPSERPLVGCRCFSRRVGVPTLGKVGEGFQELEEMLAAEGWMIFSPNKNCWCFLKKTKAL